MSVTPPINSIPNPLDIQRRGPNDILTPTINFLVHAGLFGALAVTAIFSAYYPIPILGYVLSMPANAAYHFYCKLPIVSYAITFLAGVCFGTMVPGKTACAGLLVISVTLVVTKLFGSSCLGYSILVKSVAPILLPIALPLVAIGLVAYGVKMILQRFFSQALAPDVIDEAQPPLAAIITTEEPSV